MGGFTRKTLCIAIGLLSSVTLSFSQDGNRIAQRTEQQIFDDKLPQAEADIMRMDEAELRAFTGVLVDCRYVALNAGPHFRMVCNSARQKYRIEYGRDRAVDYVMTMLEVSGEKNLTVSTNAITSNAIKRGEQAERAITLDEIKKVIEAAQVNLPPSSVSTIVNAELRLQKAASESFKRKRQP